MTEYSSNLITCVKTLRSLVGWHHTGGFIDWQTPEFEKRRRTGATLRRKLRVGQDANESEFAFSRVSIGNPWECCLHPTVTGRYLEIIALSADHSRHGPHTDSC
jgi:hypothetical protein